MDRDNAMVQASLLDLGNLVVIFCCGAVVLRPPPKMNTPLVKMKTPPHQMSFAGPSRQTPLINRHLRRPGVFLSVGGVASK